MRVHSRSYVENSQGQPVPHSSGVRRREQTAAEVCLKVVLMASAFGLYSIYLCIRLSRARNSSL